MAFIEKKGVNLQTRFLGYARKDIKHLGEFIQTLQVSFGITSVGCFPQSEIMIQFNTKHELNKNFMKEIRQSSQRNIFSNSLLQVQLEFCKVARFVGFERNLKAQFNCFSSSPSLHVLTVALTSKWLIMSPFHG